MTEIMSYDFFEDAVSSYRFTEKQCYCLYRSYLKKNARMRKYHQECDVEQMMACFDHSYATLVNEGYSEDEIVEALTRDLFAYETGLELKLLVLEGVKDEKKQLVLHYPYLLHFSAHMLYAKTRLWKDLDKPRSYKKFLRLSNDALRSCYNVTEEELLQRYPLDRPAIVRLLSRKKVNQMVADHNAEKVFEKRGK